MDDLVAVARPSSPLVAFCVWMAAALRPRDRALDALWPMFLWASALAFPDWMRLQIFWCIVRCLETVVPAQVSSRTLRWASGSVELSGVSKESQSSPEAS